MSLLFGVGDLGIGEFVERAQEAAARAETAATAAAAGGGLTTEQVAALNSSLQKKLDLAGLSSEFATATAANLTFDGSVWERKSGSQASNGGTVIGGPSGFYYARKYSGPMDIRWFGAKAEAGFDNSTAIQAALNAVPNTTSVRGAKVLIPPGFWEYNTKLSIPVNTRVTMEGIGTAQYNESGGSGSVLVWKGSSNGVMLEYDGGTATRHNGPTLDGINLFCADTTTTLIRFRYVTHWNIRNCSLKGGGVGFELDAGIGVPGQEGNDNAWGLWQQNILLDQALYGIKTVNGTFGFTMMGGDTQVAANAVGVYLDEFSQHVRLIGTKHDRGNPAIYVKGGHTHMVGVSIENAMVGVRFERVPTRADGTANIFSGKFNQLVASSIVGWAGTETGVIMGNLTANNTVQFEGVNLASRLVDNGADTYQLVTNGIWRLQSKVSTVAVQEYNIGTTLAGQVKASGNGVIWEGGGNAPNFIVRPNTNGGLKVQDKTGATDWTFFGQDGRAYHRGYFDFIEQSADPAAPSGDQGRIFTRDNGSGKTQLCVRFATGGIIVLATEA